MNKELLTIYIAGLLQGIALVAYPAASSIFTNPDAFDLNATEYGTLFIPQTLLAIAASAFSAWIIMYLNAKKVFLAGMASNFLSMLCLTLSSLVMQRHELAYSLLLTGTAFLGLGFGLTVPTLNMTAALLKPDLVNKTLLVLNALLGIGTALAPAAIALFGVHHWWVLPLTLSVLFLSIFSYGLFLSLPGGGISFIQGGFFNQIKFPPKRFWIFSLFAVLYGIIETVNGNWSSLYMKDVQHVPLATQSLALMLFWGMVTFGRWLFAQLENYVSEQSVFSLLPFVAAVAFSWIWLLPPHQPIMSLCAFALAGLGCSALLPLSISFGTQQITELGTYAAGGIIASYLIGYGIAAFGVGHMMEQLGFHFNTIFLWAAFVALALGSIALTCITKKQEAS